MFVGTIKKVTGGYEAELRAVWGRWEVLARDQRTGPNAQSSKLVGFYYRPTINDLTDRLRSVVKGESLTIEVEY